jgi:hypothetical protein
MTAFLPDDLKANGQYTKKQTSEILKIGRSTLDKHILERNIKVKMHRYSKRLTIQGSEIIRFFNAQA